MEIRLLGPVEVIDDDGAFVALASARQRLLVAGLCVQAGNVVSPDTLVEAEGAAMSDGDALSYTLAKLPTSAVMPLPQP